LAPSLQLQSKRGMAMRFNLLISIFLTIFLTGCGQGFEVASLEKSVNDANVELTEIEKTTLNDIDSIEIEVAELEAIDFSEYNNPNISLSQLKSLKKSLGSKLDGITESIEKLKLKITELRTKINDYILLLDPNDPNQQQIIERLEQLLLQLDRIDAILDQVIDLLKNKLDIIDQIFDRLIAQLDPSNPSHMLIRLVIEAIREMVKAKLGI
jgi:chromosome segregation ATPase